MKQQDKQAQEVVVQGFNNLRGVSHFVNIYRKILNQLFLGIECEISVLILEN